MTEMHKRQQRDAEKMCADVRVVLKVLKAENVEHADKVV